jgi:hypothetical protein
MFSFFNHRGLHRRKLALASLGSVAALAGLAFGAQGADQFEPVQLQVTGNVLVPGATAECQVQMTGGPEHVTIYSNPPGVSYQGTLETATDTVDIPVPADFPAGYVTLYVQSDGKQVVSTTAAVDASVVPATSEGMTGLAAAVAAP